jgi:hypothetical protein
VYLLETLPGESDVRACHLNKVSFLASGLAVANFLTHLRRIIHVRDIVRDLLETAAEVFDVPVGNLEEEERLDTFGQTIEEDISLDILEIECWHFGWWEMQRGMFAVMALLYHPYRGRLSASFIPYTG